MPNDYDPFFRIWYCKYDDEDKLESNLPLIEITKENFLIQSQNWKENEAGV
jgi:hypothetical protein